ncbi:uncharacterized protein BO96DRAFT_391080 [Aspergillus niger CBS 101883]|uniref:uncharacterized protein n=1 Tax=Aspergillus lacticoffeatus (strain CBS 101883) TaxID=1450533 RepID=UPI000D7FC4B6|nr:uncharacterized protein BO96DRAFT_391080 [Aspergillus niger CBS 101883]PYH57701.1 hypothetical protein BO96DRAFT_391080 [Aspergillus niger CBS 101883]
MEVEEETEIDDLFGAQMQYTHWRKDSGVVVTDLDGGGRGADRCESSLNGCWPAERQKDTSLLLAPFPRSYRSPWWLTASGTVSKRKCGPVAFSMVSANSNPISSRKGGEFLASRATQHHDHGVRYYHPTKKSPPPLYDPAVGRNNAGRAGTDHVLQVEDASPLPFRRVIPGTSLLACPTQKSRVSG